MFRAILQCGEPPPTVSSHLGVSTGSWGQGVRGAAADTFGLREVGPGGVKPLPASRIPLGVSLSSIQVTISRVPGLGVARPDSTLLHHLILDLTPRAI